ncbi:hypothetical protein BC830DRAFT_587781 [Chytriomyces sp. MP71]|nr:hypothetical protein BC830DRAFT_587781 [Chytriomyces sp. MP71]
MENRPPHTFQESSHASYPANEVEDEPDIESTLISDLVQANDYATRTDSLHHISSEDSENEGVGNYTSSSHTSVTPMVVGTLPNNEQEPEIAHSHLSSVAPTSLEPRMDLESGLYVEGTVIQGVVGEGGVLEFAHTTRRRFTHLSRILSTEPSDYSLEIPDLTTGTSSDDDDETWLPIDRSSPFSFQSSPQSANMNPPEPQSSSSQRPDDFLPLQRRYPRSFRMATANATTLSNVPEVSATTASSQVESDSMSRARQIEALWNASSDFTASVSSNENVTFESNTQEIELSASNNVTSDSLTEQSTSMLRDLGYSTTISHVERAARLRTAFSTAEVTPISLTRSYATSRGARYLPASNSRGRRASRQRTPNNNLRFSDLGLNFFHANDHEINESDLPVYPRLEHEPLRTGGIPSRQEYRDASSHLQSQDPWITAVRHLDAGLRREPLHQGGAHLIALVATAALTSINMNSDTYQDDDDDDMISNTRWTFMQPLAGERAQRAGGEQVEFVSPGVSDWVRRVQVSITRRLYRPQTPASTLTASGHTTFLPDAPLTGIRTPPFTPPVFWNADRLHVSSINQAEQAWVPEEDESIQFDLPLYEWLLTRRLLDSNGNIHVEVEQEEATTVHQSGIYRRGRSASNDVCGFDVLGGGSDLLLGGLDENGNPVREPHTVSVEEAVFEYEGDYNGVLNADLQGVHVVQMSFDDGPDQIDR